MAPKLVIQSSGPREIGETYRGNLTDPQAIHRPGQVFKVIKESTREEYVECLVSLGKGKEWAEMLSHLDPYFYEIQTD